METGKKRLMKYILADLLIYAVSMGIFIAIFYLVPYTMEGEGKVMVEEKELETFEMPERSDQEKNGTNTEESDDSGRRGKDKNGRSQKNSMGGKMNRSNTDTEEIVSDDSEVVKTIDSDTTDTVLHTYRENNSDITIIKKEMGTGDDKVTYYVADIYISSMSVFKTAFAQDKYGTNIKEDAVNIAESNSAILAITGDSYGNNTTGIVVRNGVLYRDDVNEADVCVLYTDGKMETFTAQEFDKAGILEKDVWQVWCFGPALLDENGDVPSEFMSTSYISGEHPRAAIGYVEQGHYVFVVADGRDVGYSKGASLSELAAIMVKEGCVSAYNLDGGGSVGMVFDGSYVNQSSGRDVSDIIYIEK